MLGKFKPLIFLLIPLFIVIAAASEEDEIGKVTFPLGEVKISRDSGNQWETASLNCPVYNGDFIGTGAESRCEITMRDGSIIRLGEKSEMRFDRVEAKTDGLQRTANLAVGSIWTNLRKLKSDNKAIAVKTPTSVMAVRGTIFRAEAAADSSTSVLVYEGALDVKLTEELEKKVLEMEKRKPGPPKQIEGPQEIPGPYEVTLAEWKRIVAGMQINIRGDGKYHSFEFDPIEDAKIDWVGWNKERDSHLKR